ncbi:DmsC/YnfH family molybdoenzyme membrane anchor subunit [Pelagibius sp. 7325]|uniref:dimethyl sulfoxide reductase anchor subunit family protein n=1 Tax=Pelagibius sp. 7325 TaxID=3131994 RepID=UPI0030EE96FB
MHPAKSVILFTTASGAGYGLLAWLGVLAALGLLPAERWLGVAGFGIGLGLVVLGLLSSTFHLGHPERAWRALSQWRSSWLSREGVAAVVTFLPVGIFALLWVVAQTNSGAAAAVGLLASVCCAVTVACTAMIYASLRTIRAWSNAWTLPAYLALSAFSGALLMNLLLQLWGLPLARAFGWAVLVLAVLSGAIKLGYWRSLASQEGASTAESATGLGGAPGGRGGSPGGGSGGGQGRVRLLEAPHSESNYLLQEMGFRIARKHAAKLRRIALVAGFLLPIVCVILGLALGGAVPAVLAALAAVAAMALGLAVERWLFFAEAKHVVTLYYGESRA